MADDRITCETPCTEFSQCIRSVQTEVTDLVLGASVWLAQRNVEDASVSEAALVLAEALNNVVEHAYGFSEDGRISVFLACKGRDLRIVIKDCGRDFAGVLPDVQMTDQDCALEDLPEGGFGWFLIKTLAKDVQFSRDGHLNRLALSLRVAPAAGRSE
jgi:serine/threonine-protein kinase RsbW